IRFQPDHAPNYVGRRRFVCRKRKLSSALRKTPEKASHPVRRRENSCVRRFITCARASTAPAQPSKRSRLDFQRRDARVFVLPRLAETRLPQNPGSRPAVTIARGRVNRLARPPARVLARPAPRLRKKGTVPPQANLFPGRREAPLVNEALPPASLPR